MSNVALSGNASGTGTFTIASPNSNTDRTLDLPDNSGTVVSTGSTAAVTQAMLATAVLPLGVVQTWQDVTSSRAKNTTYTNSTGRPIFIAVAISSNSVANISFSINGVLVVEFYIPVTAANATTPITYVIPAGATYGFNNGPANIATWFELR
jgi:hypothetical protein